MNSCHIDWCTHDHVAPSDGHCSDTSRPVVVATGEPLRDTPALFVAIWWAEVNGLDPMVTLHAEGGHGRPDDDFSVDLRPGEARRLAAALTVAAEAAEAAS